LKILVEMRVNGLHGFPGEIAAPDAGLIRDHKQSVACVLQGLESRRGARDQHDAIEVAKITGVLHDRTVPVEEDGAVAGGAVH
jgi:hypothetical protein